MPRPIGTTAARSRSVESPISARVNPPTEILPSANGRLTNQRLELPSQLVLPANGTSAGLDLVVDKLRSVAFNGPVDVEKRHRLSEPLRVDDDRDKASKLLSTRHRPNLAGAGTEVTVQYPPSPGRSRAGNPAETTHGQPSPTARRQSKGLAITGLVLWLPMWATATRASSSF